MNTFKSRNTAESPKPVRGVVHRFLREWVLPIGAVVAVMAPIRSSIADWNDVPSGSMRPTILEGDRIYVNKLAFGLRIPFTTSWIATWDAPSRGDIITFASPADGTRLVKRVVGLPGDRISMRANKLTVNGREIEYDVADAHAEGMLPDGAHVPIVLATESLPGRDHSIAVTPGLSSMKSFGEVVVPGGQYFVMGDNRDQSYDSRFIGFVPRESIYGRCGYVALSVDPTNAYAPRWDRWMSELK